VSHWAVLHSTLAQEVTLKITEGKLKRLKAVAGENGVISAAAMDQRGSLQKSIAKENRPDMTKLKKVESQH
jgi:tagatose-1,6-bisphosphate aldolase